jgi:hypothetical protein
MRTNVAVMLVLLAVIAGCKPPPPAVAPPATGGSQAAADPASGNPAASAIPSAGDDSPTQAKANDPEFLAALDWIGEDAVAVQIIHPQRILKSPLWAQKSPDHVVQQVADVTGLDYRQIVQIVTVVPGAATPRPFMQTRIIRFKEPVFGPQWMAKALRITKPKTHERGDYYLNLDDPRNPHGGWQADERTIILGMEDQLLTLMAGKPAKSPLADYLRKADLDKDCIVAFVPDAATRASTRELLGKLQELPPERRFIPVELAPTATNLADGLMSVVFSVDLSREPFIECVAEASSPAAAKDLETFATQMRPRFLAMFRQSPGQYLRQVPAAFGAAAASAAEQALASLRLEPRGNGLVATASMPRSLADEVPRSLATVRDVVPLTRLKKIVIAMHTHHDAFRELPPAKMQKENWGPDGKPNLSWRVTLLPYLGEEYLFKQFHLSEPWNSEHNLKLLDRMPEVFKTGDDPQKTSIVAVCGPAAVFNENGKGSHFGAIKDGTSKTILIVQAGPDKAIFWTKPEDVPLVPANPLSALGKVGDTLSLALCDGTVKQLSTTIPPDKLTALFTADGGEYVNLADFEIKEAASASPAAAATNPMPVTPAAAYAQQRAAIGRLSKVVSAMHNYNDSFRELPPSKLLQKEVLGPDGKPNLSWRVLLLPFLDEQNLFKQFRLNEPWDSEHNLKLLDEMPEVYKTGDDPQKTSIVVVRGAGAVFDENEKVSNLNAIKDGIYRTILIVQAGPDKAVPWTKPEDVPLVPADPLSALGNVGDTIIVALCDGAVKKLSTAIPPDKLTALFTTSGGEQVKVADFEIRP